MFVHRQPLPSTSRIVITLVLVAFLGISSISYGNYPLSPPLLRRLHTQFRISANMDVHLFCLCLLLPRSIPLPPPLFLLHSMLFSHLCNRLPSLFPLHRKHLFPCTRHFSPIRAASSHPPSSSCTGRSCFLSSSCAFRPCILSCGNSLSLQRANMESELMLSI